MDMWERARRNNRAAEKAREAFVHCRNTYQEYIVPVPEDRLAITFKTRPNNIQVSTFIEVEKVERTSIATMTTAFEQLSEAMEVRHAATAAHI